MAVETGLAALVIRPLRVAAGAGEVESAGAAGAAGDAASGAVRWQASGAGTSCGAAAVRGSRRSPNPGGGAQVQRRASVSRRRGIRRVDIRKSASNGSAIAILSFGITCGHAVQARESNRGVSIGRILRFPVGDQFRPAALSPSRRTASIDGRDHPSRGSGLPIASLPIAS